MAVPMAGGCRGTYFLPEIGDEVLLAFDHGDIRSPYMIGALWNERHRPPEQNQNGENNIRTLRSRSGHELRFNDKSGGEQIEIKTQSGHVIRLDDTAGSEKIEIRDSEGSNKVLIDSAQGSVEVESSLTLRIKSQQIEIEADASIDINASGTVTLKGGPDRDQLSGHGQWVDGTFRLRLSGHSPT